MLEDLRGFCYTDAPRDDELLRAIEGVICSLITQSPEVCEPHNLRTRRIGTTIAVDVHVRVDGAMDVEHAHALTVEIERRLRDRFGESAIITIHVEPRSHTLDQ